MAWSESITVGTWILDKCIYKKYGVTVFTPYDNKTVYKTLHNSYIFSYEPGPRIITNSTKNGYPKELILKDIVWVRKETDDPTAPQCMLYAESTNKMSRYYRDSAFSQFLSGNTGNHPLTTELYQKFGMRHIPQSINDYSIFVNKFIAMNGLIDRLQKIREDYVLKEKKDFAKYCKDNKLTKEQKKEYKAAEKLRLTAKSVEEKNVAFMQKELDMLSKLSVTISVLIDECQDMQRYLSNPDNKLNIRFYESRVKEVKNAILTIRNMKQTTDKKKRK